MLKKVLFLTCFSGLPLAGVAQTMIYGLVRPTEKTSVQEKALYRAIEEGFIDGFFEAGEVSFNLQDERAFSLEAALYAAKISGCQRLLIWQISGGNALTYQYYEADGRKIKEEGLQTRDYGIVSAGSSAGDLFFKTAQKTAAKLQAGQ